MFKYARGSQLTQLELLNYCYNYLNERRERSRLRAGPILLSLGPAVPPVPACCEAVLHVLVPVCRERDGRERERGESCAERLRVAASCKMLLGAAPCNWVLVGGWMDGQGMGVAVHRHSPPTSQHADHHGGVKEKRPMGFL